ncbi:MAG TPA: lipase maturation factor family protein [Bryobacteraceae bacterium]|nr:lipase maturation factor family protein [Bryobacteraceae bacterium]
MPSSQGKPTLIYDGHCGFCRLWLNYAKALADGEVEWIAYQDLCDRFPQIPREQFKESAFFVDANGSIKRGAAAMFSVLAISPRHRWWMWLHQHFAPFRIASDLFYRQIAKHRGSAFHLTRALFGSKIRPLTYGITESLFVRLLGIIFLFAFWSLHSQMLGLVGSQGLIPAAQTLHSMRAAIGTRAFLFAPSLLWLHPGDAWLQWMSSLGIVASLLLVFSGWLGQSWQRIATAACFVLYLSLASVGQPFTLFQWDALLLETAFLALFAGTPLLPWAYRLLVFRLMFESGCVKLLSGDPNWRNLHALRYHFMTQPLPNPIAWYVYQAPGWLLDSFTFLTLLIELACPWLLFLPRRARHIGAIVLIVLQLLILFTGNYAFFNWLTIILCLWAFDDRTFQRLGGLLRHSVAMVTSAVRRKLLAAVLACLMILGAVQVVALFTPVVAIPFGGLYSLAGALQIVNSYGLFAVMTTTRPELIYEGSDDGQNWKEYSFPYKPGNVKRGLPMVAPFQPRLDWQLWFAALDGSYQADRWTGNLVIRILQGDKAVMDLLGSRQPFSKPPKYVRVALYDYWFTSEAERRKTGAIWNRRFERLYLPSISLEALQRR